MYDPNTEQQVCRVQNTEFAGKPEICKKLIEHIIYLRRAEKVDEHKTAFFTLVNENIDELINNLDTRWLLSVCDTIADYGTDAERGNAMQIVIVCNMLKIFDTYLMVTVDPRFQQEKLDAYHPQRLWNGIWSFNIREGDMPENMFRRVTETTKSTPIIHQIWKALIVRINEHNNCLTRLQTFHSRGYFNGL